MYLAETETVYACYKEAETGKESFFHVIFIM
jgi:hypothetical protein